MGRPGRALVVSCALLALGGCADGGGPTAAPSPATTAAVTPSVGLTAPLTGDKLAADASLPAQVAGWTSVRRQDGVDGAKVRLYERSGQAGRLVATVTPVVLTSAALAATLTGPRQIGPATCGNLAGGNTVVCYVPLSGGNLSVTAPLSLDELGAVTQQLYAALP